MLQDVYDTACGAALELAKCFVHSSPLISAKWLALAQSFQHSHDTLRQSLSAMSQHSREAVYVRQLRFLKDSIGQCVKTDAYSKVHEVCVRREASPLPSGSCLPLRLKGRPLCHDCLGTFPTWTSDTPSVNNLWVPIPQWTHDTLSVMTFVVPSPNGRMTPQESAGSSLLIRAVPKNPDPPPPLLRTLQGRQPHPHRRPLRRPTAGDYRPSLVGRPPPAVGHSRTAATEQQLLSATGDRPQRGPMKFIGWTPPASLQTQHHRGAGVGGWHPSPHPLDPPPPTPFKGALPVPHPPSDQVLAQDSVLYRNIQIPPNTHFKGNIVNFGSGVPASVMCLVIFHSPEHKHFYAALFNSAGDAVVTARARVDRVLLNSLLAALAQWDQVCEQGPPSRQEGHVQASALAAVVVGVGEWQKIPFFRR